jgi:hypothetical protein
MTTVQQTVDQLQREAMTYFQTMPLPKGIIVEVWSIDENVTDTCQVGDCDLVGFVFIGSHRFCVGHGSIMISGLMGRRRHVSIDVARPVELVEKPVETSNNLTETTLEYLRFIAQHRGGTITVDMARRARGLVTMWERQGTDTIERRQDDGTIQPEV